MNKDFLCEENLKKLEKDFENDLKGIGNLKDLEIIRVKYLGRKSLINQFFSHLPNLSKEERGVWGKKLNILKNKINSFLEEKKKDLQEKEEKVDLTFPSQTLRKGSIHILSLTIEKICKIFEKLGFKVSEGKEIEDEWHNFSALNIPLEHPSRDVFDTFYLERNFLLRSHTSPSQIRIMEKYKPPLAVISPGRVYRPDEVDASHSFMFHQIEGFAVDKNLNFSHLKGVLLYFAKEFFGPNVKLRFRPHFFPFTEPSAEVDISCIICGGKIKGKKCSVCKGKGWLEILGCGMIHPQVLKNCGIDPKKYQGFAFGMGVERITMLKYGINDIRLFFENDERFLKQFNEL
jgi:phenylalanyl-tRNA synthetase alpha chain